MCIRDRCNWRKKHNQIKGFSEPPNNKNLEQPKDQSEKEIVKDVEVEQQKKILEPIQQKEARGGMNLQQLWELINERLDKGFESIDNHFKKMDEKLDRFNEELRETLYSGSKKLSETLDRDSKSVEEPVIMKTEDGSEETELKEENSILISTNKDNSHKENIQIMEVTTKKRHPRKLINTREELEMMKNGLLAVSYTHLTHKVITILNPSYINKLISHCIQLSNYQ